MDDPALLYVSDDPEKFSGHGKLFSATLPSDNRVARILFDHVNASGGPMQVIVAIANTGDATGKVAVAGCDAGPGPGIDGRNGMQVGHVATIGFLNARLLTAGGSIVEFTLAKGESKVLNSPRVLQTATASPKRDGECTAGIYDFLALEPGTTYELRVMACDSGSDESVWDEDDFSDADNPDPAHRSGVFDIENSGAEQTIAFGKAASFGDKRYDRVPELDTTGDTNQYEGEYGVTKRFACTLNGNPIAFLYQFTGAPGATASYVVNKTTLLASHQFSPPPKNKPPILHRVVQLTAPSTSIITMAEINSSLPVNLKVGANDGGVAALGSANAKVYPPTVADAGPSRAEVFTA